MEKIGMIAGGGGFPFLFARAARAKGFSVVAAAIEGETDPSLAHEVDELRWVPLGKYKRLVEVFKSSGVKELVMVGTISKGRVFEKIHPDFKGALIWTKLKARGDDNILTAIADEMAGDGLTVRPSTELLPELLAPEGRYTRRKPTRGELDDMDLGFDVARRLGDLDIGQCVVVREGVVLAVEGLEGTDECILRAGRLGKGRLVVVKRAKPSQDLRFDLPAVGAQTIETMREAGGVLLAVDAGKTVIFGLDEMVEAADREGIAVLGVKRPEED